MSFFSNHEHFILGRYIPIPLCHIFISGHKMPCNFIFSFIETLLKNNETNIEWEEISWKWVKAAGTYYILCRMLLWIIFYQVSSFSFLRIVHKSIQKTYIVHNYISKQIWQSIIIDDSKHIFRKFQPTHC